MTLMDIGVALHSDIRIEIIEYLRRVDEITIDGAMELLRESRTAAQYNLQIMSRCGVLNSRIENRVKYFSLNRDWFREASEVLTV